MFSSIPVVTTFAGSAPPWSLQALDNNFSGYNAGLLSANSFSNYIVDTGVVNAYVAAIALPQTATLSAGLMVQVKIATTNTGASTLNVGGTGVKNIVFQDGSALQAGHLLSGGVYVFLYDGTNYQLVSTTYAAGSFVATATGFTVAITGTVFYTIIGNVVTMDVPVLGGTSNSTTFTITGIPAAVQPASTKEMMIAVTDNGTPQTNPALVSLSAGTITLGKTLAASGGFTNSGGRQSNAFTMRYTLR